MIPGQGTEIPKAVQGGRKRKTYELKSDAGKKLNTHTHTHTHTPYTEERE